MQFSHRPLNPAIQPRGGFPAAGRLWLALALGPVLAGAALARAAVAEIFPIPQEIVTTDAPMVLNGPVTILVPTEASAPDLFAARELATELGTRFAVPARIERAAAIPEVGAVIVMGRFDSPLLRPLCAARKLDIDANHPGPEGYVLAVEPRLALVAGSDDRGVFYGMQSLRQLIRRTSTEVVVDGVRVRDWPHTSFRAIKLYLPGPDNLPYFKRFVRDFMALNKFNQVIVEMNAAMQLDRHPELNVGWTELTNSLLATRRNRPAGPRGEEQDSVHHDNADGAILTKRDVAELVRFAREYHVDVVPEIPSLSHAYHLLTRHREIAEIPTAEWPDAYCPSNPASYELLFDVLDEYIEVMKPRLVHVGHDEWRIPVGECPRCRGRDPRELFADDLVKIHDWLATRGVGTMIWGDHLIERLRGKGTLTVKRPDGTAYQRPGGLSAEMVLARIPKDILIANWMWQEPYPGQGEVNDLDLARWGFRQFYGNLEPQIRNWGRRSANPSVIGGAPSSWAATTEFNFGKDQVYDFMVCANLLWSSHWPAPGELTATVQSAMPAVRERLGGRIAPSRLGDPQSPVSLAATKSSGDAQPTGAAGPLRFAFAAGTAAITVKPGDASPAITIGADASSLVFLHAIDTPAENQLAYRMIHDFEDTADLLGHYEVRYNDGFVATIPIRYGVHLLESTWTPAKRPRTYCYLADPVTTADGQTFFAYEWRNPRPGKTIDSVVLKAASGFVNARGVPAGAHTVLLRAITLVQPRPLGAARHGSEKDLDN